MADRAYDWSAIAQNPKYLELKQKKRLFLFSWWTASTVFYFSLPILSGYFPELFKIKIMGPVNFGYLYILLQFVVAFMVAILYTRVANRDFDRLTDQLVKELQ